MRTSVSSVYLTACNVIGKLLVAYSEVGYKLKKDGETASYQLETYATKFNLHACAASEVSVVQITSLPGDPLTKPSRAHLPP